ncbi:MAG: carboxylate-amine ligase [Melioribacteraceae bacterium]|nr:carboxylate-amine ligase [Melioribacteraceae bacterium]MCF8353247.1 carboxylate-amine ligase [Melioribacteraceae bacterium]MCF8393979.1 carboxylate-amine ligase [Melioribacteraceae bacterium]MCF8418719.1 carboxylate-amine ligase [Melioribacteraceae bacterium]
MNENKLFSIGIEEEFQIVDPETRELKSHIQQILEDGKMVLKEQVKAEMHQSVVEVGSDVCENIQEAEIEVKKLRRNLAEVAARHDLRIAAAGTHPFSKWEDQRITDAPRYHGVVQDMQQVARANLIFGLHVHIGIDDKEQAIQIMNAARYFLPHIFALSTNSPFWKGRNTGFKSYRAKIFDRFPRTGIPDHFQSYSEFERYVALLMKTGCIEDPSKIWWDIRPHSKYSTLEFRVCDVPMLVEETLALAAICQAVVAKLHKLMQKNLGFRLYRRLLINENKWRAARYGLEGKLIDFGKQEEVDTHVLIYELLDFVDDVVDELGSREHLKFIYEILKMGTGAKRQLQIWEHTQDTKKVVDFIIEQTYKNLT